MIINESESFMYVGLFSCRDSFEILKVKIVIYLYQF